MSSSTSNSALIVDGHNLLFASYCGMPDRIRSASGEPIHGTYGFIAVVLRMLRRFKPRSVAVCFDAEEPNFRNVLDPGYKANRLPVGEGPNPFSQLADIKRGLEWLEIPWVEIGGVEADDVIGTLARRLAKSHRVYIASTDRDLYQLIDRRIRVYSRVCGRDIEYGPREIKAKYGIRPRQVVDYKTLVGDTSDNIPGVDGIGAKTAAKLLNEFGDIPGIIANVVSLTPRIATALQEGRNRLDLYKQLITIRTDIKNRQMDVDFSFSTTRDTDALNVRTVMRELGLMT